MTNALIANLLMVGILASVVFIIIAIAIYNFGERLGIKYKEFIGMLIGLLATVMLFFCINYNAHYLCLSNWEKTIDAHIVAIDTLSILKNDTKTYTTKVKYPDGLMNSIIAFDGLLVFDNVAVGDSIYKAKNNGFIYFIKANNQRFEVKQYESCE